MNQPTFKISSSLAQLAAVAAIATTALLSAGTALAQEATGDQWLSEARSTKTRAEVGAELAAARASGLTRAWSAGYLEPVRSHAVRAVVKADTVRALRSGEVAAINAEAGPNAPGPAARSLRRPSQG